MATPKTPFSKRGLNPGLRVDVDALSPVARRQIRVLRPGPRTTPFTASSTVKHNFGAVGVAGTLIAAYLSSGVLPNIATAATVQVVAYDKSGNAEVALTNAFDVEDSTTTLVAREAAAMTIATTNVALAADDTIEIHAVAGGAITTNATDLAVVLVIEPTEDATISD